MADRTPRIIMMGSSFVALLFTAALLAQGGPHAAKGPADRGASAQGHGQGQGLIGSGILPYNHPRSSCQSEIAKHCSDSAPRFLARHSCLREVRDQLSDDCRLLYDHHEERVRHIEQRKSRQLESSRNFRSLCQSDLRNHCRGNRPGRGQALSCLQENRNSIAPACRELIDAPLNEEQKLDEEMAELETAPFDEP